MNTKTAQLQEIASDIAVRYLGLQGAIAVRNRLIIDLHKEGVTQVAIAEAAGLSFQRVSQLVYDAEPEDENGTH